MEFDAARHIGAISRQVIDSERGGKPARTVFAERSFDTDMRDVWDAIASSDRISRWFSPISGEFRPGGHYQIEGNASGTIEECDPPRRLALSWEFGGKISWVLVTLEEEEGGRTRLELRHTALIEAEANEFWDQYGPGAVGVGWDLSLLGLAEHVERGWDKPLETETEWVRSDKYQAFVSGSSAAWRDASVNHGTDVQAATDAAERTTAFYTGN